MKKMTSKEKKERMEILNYKLKESLIIMTKKCIEGDMSIDEFTSLCYIVTKIKQEVYDLNKPIFRNILQESESIVFKRKSEKERQYGPFDESMERATKFFNLMVTDKELTTEDMFKCMIALKHSRLAYNSKHDTFLDMIGYVAGLQYYLSKKEKDV